MLTRRRSKSLFLRSGGRKLALRLGTGNEHVAVIFFFFTYALSFLSSMHLNSSCWKKKKKKKQSSILRGWISMREKSEKNGIWFPRGLFPNFVGIFQRYWRKWLYLIRVDQHRETDRNFVGCRIVWKWTNLLSLAVAIVSHVASTDTGSEPRAWPAKSNKSVVNTDVEGFNCFYGNSNGNVVDENDDSARIRSDRAGILKIKKRNFYCLLKMMLLRK